MKIKKYLPILLSTVCISTSTIAVPTFQPNSIVSASASTIVQENVNGLNVTKVKYGEKNDRGYFRQQSNGSWVEKNKDGRFTFTELNRDEWSVYLLKSDGLKIQLDLHRKEVIWMGKGKLYDITSASKEVKNVKVIEAGAIWNQSDANQKCPQVASENGGEWTGQWWTTIPNKMSVCQIKSI